MTSLFQNIREKQDGHMQISLKMLLPAMRSFLFRKRSETVQPAGRRWNVLGKNSSAMNSGLPAKGKVVNIYRETYKCPECAISEEHPDDQTFVKAPVQEALIPESYASESVVGWAMHQKYQNGLPLNRQESEWKQLGVPFSRATLANWIIYCAENYLRHVYDYFHRQLRMRKYLMADETRVQVLNEPGRNPETDSWMWLFRSGGRWTSADPALPLHRDKGKVPCSIFPTGVQRISGDGWIPGL